MPPNGLVIAVNVIKGQGKQSFAGGEAAFSDTRSRRYYGSITDMHKALTDLPVAAFRIYRPVQKTLTSEENPVRTKNTGRVGSVVRGRQGVGRYAVARS